MFSTPIGRLRVIGLIEGVSYLVLLLIAMPLKYMAGYPEAVKYTGMLHGVFFVLYGLAVGHATIANKWSFLKVMTAFLAAIIPIGNFVFDRELKKEENVVIVSKL